MTMCRICKNSGRLVSYSIKEMMYGSRESFNYNLCPECDCLQIKTYPSDVARFYPKDYYSFSSINEVQFKESKEYKKRLNSLKKILESYSLIGKKDSDILDIGCGSGLNFLYPLVELGYKNASGIDPYISQSISYKNGLDIKKEYIDQQTRKWDFISCHHSFEHMMDQEKQLKSLCSLLKDDGEILLRIPILNQAWEIYREHWYQIDAPRHFYLHSLKSIKYLCEKSGLKISSVLFDSTISQFKKSERYKSNIASNEKPKRSFADRLKWEIKKIKWNYLTKKFNREQLGDQATFILKKF